MVSSPLCLLQQMLDMISRENPYKHHKKRNITYVSD